MGGVLVVWIRKGEKKTLACRSLTAAISRSEEEVQESLRNPGHDNDGPRPDDANTDKDEEDNDKPIPEDKMPQLLVDYFSPQELYNSMNWSGCQVS